MDVDWARTDRGIREFDPLVVRDYQAKGLTHVRTRVAESPGAPVYTSGELVGASAVWRNADNLPIRLLRYIKKYPVRTKRGG